MEYAEKHGNQLTNVARSSRGISTLYEATGGNPSSSPRWHANMTYGADQEMIAALRTHGGDVWGALSLYRQPDRPLFDPDEKAFLAAISPLMADAIRRALLIGESADPEASDAPGMIVFGPDWHTESMSAHRRGSSLPQHATGARRIQPRSTRFELAPHQGDVTRRFLTYSSPSRSPDPDHLAVLARPGFVRAAPTRTRHLPGQAALSFAALPRQGQRCRSLTSTQTSEVDPERGTGLTTDPFLRVASRTRRAPLSAPGSPQVPWVCGFPHAVLGHGVGMRVPR
jgi:hypothetical protein